MTGDFRRLVNAGNPLTVDKILPLAGPGSRSASVAGLGLEAVLIRTADTAAMERFRTLLAEHASYAPMSFAEAAQVRATLYGQVENIALAMVALTLIVGGCSLNAALLRRFPRLTATATSEELRAPDPGTWRLTSLPVTL